MRNFTIAIVIALIGTIIITGVFMKTTQDREVLEKDLSSLEQHLQEINAESQRLRDEIAAIIIADPGDNVQNIPPVTGVDLPVVEPSAVDLPVVELPVVTPFDEEEIQMVRELNAVVREQGEYAANYQNTCESPNLSDAQKAENAQSMRALFDDNSAAGQIWYYYDYCTWEYVPCYTKYLYEVPSLWKAYNDDGEMVAIAVATWQTMRGCFSDFYVYTVGTQDLSAPIDPYDEY